MKIVLCVRTVNEDAYAFWLYNTGDKAFEAVPGNDRILADASVFRSAPDCKISNHEIRSGKLGEEQLKFLRLIQDEGWVPMSVSLEFKDSSEPARIWQQVRRTAL